MTRREFLMRAARIFRAGAAFVPRKSAATIRKSGGGITAPRLARRVLRESGGGKRCVVETFGDDTPPCADASPLPHKKQAAE